MESVQCLHCERVIVSERGMRDLIDRYLRHIDWSHPGKVI